MTLEEARKMIQAYAERSRDQDTPARVPSERETMAACIVLDAMLKDPWEND